MSRLPNLPAPDGFELAVFARAMLSQLPAASAPLGFEEAVLQKSTGATAPQTIRPARRLGIGWKTTLAACMLLTTLGTVTLFTGLWSSVGIVGNEQTDRQDAPRNVLPNLPPLPNTPHIPANIKKADPRTKRAVVKVGKSAVKAGTQAVAGYNSQPSTP